MATEADIDIALNDVGPLVWILREVDASLDAARASIRKFLREQQESARDGTVADTSTLRSAKAQVHQAVGAVQVVGVPGAASFLRALESALDRCVQRPELLGNENQLALEKAMNALRDYMQSIIAGRKPQPVKLFVQYAALQALAEAERIHPADLWELEFEWRDVPLADKHVAWSGPLGSQFEKALLMLLRGSGAEAGAQMRAPLAALGAASTSQQGRGFWAMAAGVAEAMASGRLKVDDHIKRAFTRINLQVKQFLTGNHEVSERNARDLLFFCAQAGEIPEADHPTLAQVRRVYALSRFEPIDYTRSHFGAIDPSVVKQAQKRVVGVKELWAELSNGDITRTKALLESIDLVTDSLAQVQPGTEDLGASLAGIVKASVKDPKFLNAERSLEVANALLFLEASFGHVDPGDPTFRERCANLKLRLDSVARGLSAGAMEPWMEQLYHQASESQTMGSVVQELKTSLGAIEASLDKYFRDPSDKASLAQVPAQLGQMRGVLSVLGLDQAGAAVAHARSRTEDWLLASDRPPQEQFDQLAQNIGSLSFMIDLLAFQPTLTRSLFVFDADKGEFRAVMGRSEPAKATPPAASVTVTSTVPPVGAAPAALAEPMALDLATGGAVAAATAVASTMLPSSSAAASGAGAQPSAMASASAGTHLPSAATTTSSAAPAAAAAAMPATVASPPAPTSSPIVPVTSEEDDELLGIFLDEARDVVAGGLEQVAHLRRFNADSDSQITVRRAFHTLKGSSRMVGLVEFGEAAWQLEQVFNGWLAQQRPATEPLLDLAKDALEHFDQWVDRISQRHAVSGWTAAFTRSAEAFKSGSGYLPIVVDKASAAATPIVAAAAQAATVEAASSVAPLAAPLSTPPAAAAAVLAPTATVPADAMSVGSEASVSIATASPLPSPAVAASAAAVDLGEHSPPGDPADLFQVDEAPPVSAPEVIETTVESTDDLLALFDPVAVTPEPPAAPAPAADVAAPLEVLDFSLDLTAVDSSSASSASASSSIGTTESVAPSPVVTPDSGPLTDDFVFDIGALGDSSAAPAAAQITAATADQAPAPFAPEPASADAGSTAALLESAPANPSGQVTTASNSGPAVPDLESLFVESVDVSANGASTSSAYQPTLLLSPEQAKALHAELGIASGGGAATAVAADTPMSSVAPEVGVVTASGEAPFGNVGIAGSAAPPAIDAQGPGDSALAPSMPVDVVGVVASLTATSEAEAFTEMSAVAEDIKVIGPLQVPVQLYTIFLSEADELVRQLNMRLDEWRLMPGANVPDEAISAAHTLGGTAGIVGLSGLSGLGYEMEAALLACRGNGHMPNDFQLGVLLAGADEMRRLLHHFAAGFYREANADVRSAVHELAIQWHANYGPRMTSAAIPASASAQASDAEEADAPSLPDLAAPLAEAASLSTQPPTEPESLTVTSVPIESPTSDASWPPAPPTQPQPTFTSGFMSESADGESTARAIPDSSAVGTMTTAFAVSELTLPPIDVDAERKSEVSLTSERLEAQAPASLPAMPDTASEPMAQQAAFDVDGGADGPDWAGQMGAEPAPASASSAEIPSLEPTPRAAAQNLSEPMEVSASDSKASPGSAGSSNELASSTIPALAVAALAPLAAAVSTLAPPPAPVVTAERARVTIHDTAADSDLDEVDVDLFPIFEEEALELIPQLAQALRDWQAQPGQTQFPKQALRTLHTLKGSARLAGAMRLGDMAHQLETAVEQVIREDSPGTGIADLIERADEIANRFEQLRRGEVHSAHEYEFHASSVAAPATATSTLESAEAVGSGTLDTPMAAPGDIASVELLASAEMVAPLSPPAITQTVTPAEGPAAAPTREPAASRALAPIARLGAAVAASTQAARSMGGTQAVRVRAQLLDRLFNQAGEVSITRARLETGVGTLRASLSDLTDNLARLRQQLRDIELQAETQMQSRMAAHKDSAVDFDPLEFDRFTRFQELTRMMAESVNDVATVQQAITRTLQSTEDDLQRQARMTRELQRDLLRTRMIEFESLSERLYRVVRQAAKDLGKNVRLDIEGGQIEIDRGVLDRMAGSFEHLLRNCVAHGIEPPQQRAALGKSEVGQITIGLKQEGNEVTLTFSDDGSGLHFDKIRERGIRQGLIQADDTVSEQDLAELIFTPGFSTADAVSEVAGRGIGMDVVKTEILGLGGRVTVQTQVGQGSTFTLVLPLTTAVTQIVLVRVGTMTIGVPASLVEIVQRVKPEELKRRYDSGIHPYAGTEVDFYPLGALLQVPIDNIGVERYNPIVIVRSAAQRVAVHVEEVLGNQEVVVRNLGPQLSRVPGLAGMSVLASGAVVLIYNPVALASVYGADARRELAEAQPTIAASAPASTAAAEASAQTGLTSSSPASTALVGSVTSIVDLGSMSQVMAAIQQPLPKLRLHAEPTVMVVDDSLTVRRVTQRFLQRNGFRVVQAKDGLDALEVLQSEHPHVMLLDIEMPRMDGFDLTRNMRADPLLKQIPIIMITSRIADKHKMLALELGVSHYLGKPFNEEELLSLIGRYTSNTAASAAEAN